MIKFGATNDKQNIIVYVLVFHVGDAVVAVAVAAAVNEIVVVTQVVVVAAVNAAAVFLMTKTVRDHVAIPIHNSN